jgi:hypothetical protein
LRVIDFGGSAWDKRNAPSFEDPVVPCGEIHAFTPKYRAPELDPYSDVSDVSSKVDVFSFGAMLHELHNVGVWKDSPGTCLQ